MKQVFFLSHPMTFVFISISQISWRIVLNLAKRTFFISLYVLGYYQSSNFTISSILLHKMVYYLWHLNSSITSFIQYDMFRLMKLWWLNYWITTTLMVDEILTYKTWPHWKCSNLDMSLSAQNWNARNFIFLSR